MTPNVSSSWASYDGGSDGTTKTSSPPIRGLSWALDGLARTETNARMARVSVISWLVRPCMRDLLEPGAYLTPVPGEFNGNRQTIGKVAANYLWSDRGVKH